MVQYENQRRGLREMSGQMTANTAAYRDSEQKCMPVRSSVHLGIKTNASIIFCVCLLFGTNIGIESSQIEFADDTRQHVSLPYTLFLDEQNRRIDPRN